MHDDERQRQIREDRARRSKDQIGRDLLELIQQRETELRDLKAAYERIMGFSVGESDNPDPGFHIRRYLEKVGTWASRDDVVDKIAAMLGRQPRHVKTALTQCVNAGTIIAAPHSPTLIGLPEWKQSGKKS